ncbi:hypothetical protein DFH94DRAFT_622288 [Russula ochroleuca]|jgi:hypothetical protein|uniref:Uncharacterized protein n=1 Tax=Russula ochroleuca TaxID=152965 RepID=A0A9P5TDI6_9AGAM|nr:hypothetical protein DFH94DRAFT_622288 [Russula ochroleuca]
MKNVGHGLLRAQAVAHNHPAAQQALVAPEEVPNIGDTPPDFNPNPISYRHSDILQLIIFYNDDFGIVYGDNLYMRISKFRQFLTVF